MSPLPWRRSFHISTTVEMMARGEERIREFLWRRAACTVLVARRGASRSLRFGREGQDSESWLRLGDELFQVAQVALPCLAAKRRVHELAVAAGLDKTGGFQLPQMV